MKLTPTLLALLTLSTAVASALPQTAHARKAAADDADEDEKPARADKGDADEKPSRVAATLEFMLGPASDFEIESDGGDTETYDARTTLGIIPGFDRMFGRNFGIGGEYMFVWGGPSGEDAPDERTLVMSPHMRARMSFPIWKGLTFDGLFGIGPTIWVGNNKADKHIEYIKEMRDTRFGWSLRFNFGAGWKFNESVAAFTSLGYYTTTTYGDDVTLNLNTVPWTVGLRSQF